MRPETALTTPSHTSLAVKRAVDLGGSALGLVLLLPILPLIALAIKLDSPGPIFFRQERVGRGGRLFHMFKFRSMVTAAPRLGAAITVHADARITRVGAFLRRTKLDELPQLINVVRGEMSLVGPRPEVPEFTKFYSPRQRAVILSLRPGVTDYASVIFRNESSLLDGRRDPISVYRNEIMPVKWKFYERYSNDIGLLTDLRILAATLFLTLFKRVPTSFGIEHDLRSVLETTHSRGGL
jgi:lipopolysaccharide/colanic/teichoic acid biosynthesis glycosyltransferase